MSRALTSTMREIGLFSNPYVYAGIGVVLAFQIAFVYAAPMHVVFGSAPIPVWAWAEALAAALVVVPVVAAAKGWRRRAERRDRPTRLVARQGSPYAAPGERMARRDGIDTARAPRLHP